MPNFAFTKLDRRGGLSLEFGLIALPFLMLLLGGIELARYVYTTAAVDSYADATLRAALVYVGGDSANRCLSDLTSAIAPPDLPAGLTAERVAQQQAACAKDSTTRAITISVSVAYRFTSLVTLFGSAEQSISRTARRNL